jgi:hypothetical protein
MISDQCNRERERSREERREGERERERERERDWSTALEMISALPASTDNRCGEAMDQEESTSLASMRP